MRNLSASYGLCCYFCSTLTMYICLSVLLKFLVSIDGDVWAVCCFFPADIERNIWDRFQKQTESFLICFFRASFSSCKLFMTPTETNKFLVLHGRKGTKVNGNYLYPAVGGVGISLLGNCGSPICDKPSITSLAVASHSRICRNLYYYLSVSMLSFSLLI